MGQVGLAAASSGPQHTVSLSPIVSPGVMPGAGPDPLGGGGSCCRQALLAWALECRAPGPQRAAGKGQGESLGEAEGLQVGAQVRIEVGSNGRGGQCLREAGQVVGALGSSGISSSLRTLRLESAWSVGDTESGVGGPKICGLCQVSGEGSAGGLDPRG